MKIVVGSRNPIKIEAARAVFTRIDPKAQITGVDVASGIPNQPWGDEETRRGAINRAKAALGPGIDYGVGFEGGVVDTEVGLMSCAWCAVAAAPDALGVGGSVNFLLPAVVAGQLRQGLELGSAMDRLIGGHNTKQGPGAIGILSDGLTDRQQAYEHILIMALAPFRRPDLYAQAE